MTTETWESVLIDLETRVELAAQCLNEGRDLDASVLELWTPPTDLGPLPARLRDRAVSIQKRQAEVSVRLQQAMTSISSDLQQQSHAPRKAALFAEKDIPKYFDSAV